MEQYIEISGTVVGLIYLWQEYRASIYLWITSIIMPAIYLYVYYQAGLYADFGINIYYLVIALYGWLAWRYNFSLRGKRADSKELSIGHISRVTFSHLALLFLATWAVISYILTHFTNSTVPFTDAFTTALSIVGMYMLARKYIEQWWVWLVVDVVSSALYIYKELYFTAALYALYAIIAIFGYRKWKQLMNNEKH
ncbi:MAG: nicotinamide mononucleotide transporter [Bacteroidaceae bacterium]|nr:nicotinamide mononucleotide transporter [Bacteroidaceae bacterium]